MANACTGITLAPKGNDHIQACTIECEGHNNLNSKLIIAPRDYAYTSTMTNQTLGLI
ncbi:hypothetical protein [Photobacterium phosphoreum]|uniref:hypothetical protein n=1 Tax=Photobacterium phosphoreum TaxID=659 RepID=UPI0015E760AF|nr:hypothetical protein [Photobacterium phosphoreum]MCD9502970.1 hypothetical protein [Photobacterium phosphoreum]